MACCNPPPGFATSFKNRIASSRFDLPDAFGPTIKTRSDKLMSIDRKLRQFLKLSREMIIAIYRPSLRVRSTTLSIVTEQNTEKWDCAEVIEKVWRP
jgi:hypothetical protein